jgi:hypothetical protein
MTVFVVQDSRRYNKLTGQFEKVHDVSPAKEYGELRYLLTPTASPFNPESIIPELHEGLQDFGDGDHLLLVGNPILIGWATAIAADYNEGRVSVLQWSGIRNRYLAVAAQVFEVDPGEAGD